jgi:ubiquinone biosynthesis protein UbiJ
MCAVRFARSTETSSEMSARAIQRDLTQLNHILDRWQALLRSDELARDSVQRGVAELMARLERLLQE